MSRRRFRWTRKSYQHAHSLARLLDRYLDLPDHPPAIVRQYWDLWERHQQSDDPLSTPVDMRLAWRRDDDIPF